MNKVLGEKWEEKDNVTLRKELSDPNNPVSWRELTSRVEEAHVIGEPEMFLTPEEIRKGKKRQLSS